MPLTPFWLEDFAEWPTAGVASNVGNYSGTGWTDSAGTNVKQRVEADANFASGKALRVGAQSSASNGSQYAFENAPAAGTPVCIAWNMRRIENSTDPPTDNDAPGMTFLTAAPNGRSIRIRWGSSSLGLENTLYVLTSVAGVVTARYQSPNNLFAGVKIPLALEFDPNTGTFQFWLNNDLVWIESIPDFVGWDLTAIHFGNQSAIQPTGYSRCGDFAAYYDSAYVGPTEVRNGFPSADGPDQDWAFVGAASAWEAISGLYSTTPTAYIETTVLGEVSNFECPVDPTNVFGIWGAMHRYYCIRTDVSLVDLQGSIGESGAWTFAPGAVTNPPQAAYQRFADFWGPTNPVTGFGWTSSDMATCAVEYDRQS